MSGEVRKIEKILKQQGRKLTGSYKKKLGAMAKPELLKALTGFKREVYLWQMKHADAMRKFEQEQHAISIDPALLQEQATQQPARKIQLNKAGTL